MGRARAIGIALAALFAASPPAVAPLWAAPELAHTSEASAAPLRITLDGGAPLSIRWIGASLLAPDPFAQNPAAAIGRTLPLGSEEPLQRGALAAVPEPNALGGMTLGLAGFALLRRRASAA